jgi:hypothetical protein
LLTGVEVKEVLRFHLVCVQPLQYGFPDSDQSMGYWNIPLVHTDETGPRCTGEDSYDNTYMDNVLAELTKYVGFASV